MLELARRMVNGGEDAEPVEAVFAQAEGEELLVDDGWMADEAGTEAVEVNSLPRTGYGGSVEHDLFGIGPRLEPARDSGRANGNAHLDAQAPEPQ